MARLKGWRSEDGWQENSPLSKESDAEYCRNNRHACERDMAGAFASTRIHLVSEPVIRCARCWQWQPLRSGSMVLKYFGELEIKRNTFVWLSRAAKSRLLEYNPAKRLTAQEVLYHPYFSANREKVTANCFEGMTTQYPHRRVSQDDNDIRTNSLPIMALSEVVLNNRIVARPT